MSELSDRFQLRANATDSQHDFARLVWEYMDRRSCPGIIMQIAYEAVLYALDKTSRDESATTATTGEVES